MLVFDDEKPKLVFDDETPKSTMPPTLENYAKVLPEVVKQTAGPVFKAFGRGAKQGFTFGTADTPVFEPDPMEGSIMNVKGKLRTVRDQIPGVNPEGLAQFGGHLFGTLPWIIASEMVAGATAPILISKYGIGPFRAAMTNGAIAFATFNAMKGAAQKKPVMEQVGDIGEGGLLGLGMGAGGYGLGKAREFVSQYIPRKMTNYFVGTPQKMGEKLQEQRKLPLSEQLLQKEPKLHGFKTREEVRESALEELSKEQMATQAEFQKIQEEIMKPHTPDVPIKTTKGLGPEEYAPALEYKPIVKQEIKPSGYGSDLPIAPPTAKSEYVQPFGQYTERTKATIPEYVPEKQIPFGGTREEIAYDSMGVPYRTGRLEGSADLVPPPSSGGFTRDKVIDVETTQPRFGGFTREVPVGSQPQIEPVQKGGSGTVSSGERTIAEADRSLKEPTYISYTPKQGAVIDLEGIVKNSTDDIIKGYEDAGKFESADQVRSWRQGFLRRHGNQVAIPNGNGIKDSLDDVVNKNYLKLQDAPLSPVIEAQMNVANGLRGSISTLSPTIARSMERQHRLLNIITSLSPKTAETGTMGSLGIIKTPTQMLAGSREAYGLAQFLRNSMGQPSKIIAPTTRRTIQATTQNPNPDIAAELKARRESFKNKYSKE